jgi:hypothetical protein
LTRFHAVPGISSMLRLTRLNALSPPLVPPSTEATAVMLQLKEEANQVLADIQNQTKPMPCRRCKQQCRSTSSSTRSSSSSSSSSSRPRHKRRYCSKCSSFRPKMRS